jgi:hypothetical protein
VNEDKTAGEYASLDELAGLVDPADARVGAETIRTTLIEFTDLAVTDAQVVGTPVVIRPGQALTFSALDSQGSEFEVYVRPKR